MKNQHRLVTWASVLLLAGGVGSAWAESGPSSPQTDVGGGEQFYEAPVGDSGVTADNPTQKVDSMSDAVVPAGDVPGEPGASAATDSEASPTADADAGGNADMAEGTTREDAAVGGMGAGDSVEGSTAGGAAAGGMGEDGAAVPAGSTEPADGAVNGAPPAEDIQGELSAPTDGSSLTGTGSVSASLAGQGQVTSSDQYLQAATEAMMSSLDTDGNGLVTKSEAGDQQVTEFAFIQTDANDDGHLDRNEIATLATTYEQQMKSE